MLDSNDPLLTAYVLDELDAEQRARVEAELASSAALRKRLEQLRRTCQLVGSALQTSAELELTEEQRVRIEAELEKSAERPANAMAAQRIWRTRRIWAAAIAATALLAVVWSLSGKSSTDIDFVGGHSAPSVPSSQPSGDSDEESTTGDTSSTGKHSEDGDDSKASWSMSQYGHFSDQPADFGADRQGRSEKPSTTEFPQKLSRPEERNIDGATEPGFGLAPESGGQPAPSNQEFGDDNKEHDQALSPTPHPAAEGKTQGTPSKNDGYYRSAHEAEGRPERPPVSSPQPESSRHSTEGVDGVLPRDDGKEQAAAEIDASRPETREALSEFKEISGLGRELSEPEEIASAKDNQAQEVRELEKSDFANKSGESSAKPGEPTSKSGQTAQRSWRRAAATPNASRLMVGDRDDLPLEGMQVNVKVDGFRARVLLDYYFYNNRDRQLEGSFKMRLPGDASLYYFAFGPTSFEYRPMVDHLATRGFLSSDLLRAAGTGPEEILKTRTDTWTNVKEARVVPREKAAHAYSEVVRRRVDPALVEWSGAGVFNAKVFPLTPNKLHRIVVGYDVTLRREGEQLAFDFELPTGLSECMIDFNVAALPGLHASVAPETKPFTSGGRAYYHWKDPHLESIQLRLEHPGAIVLSGEDATAGKFFATQVRAELPGVEQDARASQAIFLLDTSLSSHPAKFNVWLDLLQAALNRNRDGLKQFNVLMFNIESAWWKDRFVENTPENVAELMRECHSLSLEGATDLQQALAEAATPSWRPKGKGEPTDLFLLSDGEGTWGEQNLNQMVQTINRVSAGPLFAYNSGLTGTAIEALDHLTRATGGAVFSVANQNELVQAAVAHRLRPWRLVDVAAPGAEDLLVAGRPRMVYPGQVLLVTGRGTPEGEIALSVRRSERRETIRVAVDRVLPSELAARIYGQVAVGQLEGLGTGAEDVSVAYARHFRVTGQTCSLLMLESEADYQRFQVKPEDDAFVVKSSPAGQLVLKLLDELAQQFVSSKEAFKLWLRKLEETPGFRFKAPTSLSLAIDQMPEASFEVRPTALLCESRKKSELPAEYLNAMSSGTRDYDLMWNEATRRFDSLGSADALKALSNLVESNPGDPLVLRDIAFSAMEWKLGRQAYPLLRRVALLRPYEPQAYQALAQCLAEVDQVDLAIAYYEIALAGQWHERYQDFHQVAGTEYLCLLNQIDRGERTCSVPQFAAARRESLRQQVPLAAGDLVITMMWNTDRTDVDLHVLEPSGEECYYKNRSTRAGGRVTRDVTEGFGPEMYTIGQAENGKYRVMANYYGSDNNRTTLRSKVYVTVYEHFGDAQREQVSRHTVRLNNGREKRDVVTVKMKQ